MPDQLPDLPEALLALEEQLEREWWWLQGALNAAARLQAERLRGEGRAAWFRGLQAQAREVDRRRVEIAVRVAEMEAGAAGAR